MQNVRDAPAARPAECLGCREAEGEQKYNLLLYFHVRHRIMESVANVGAKIVKWSNLL
jgi:hypothetical protein